MISKKRKKKSSLRFDLSFRYFSPKIMVISKSSIRIDLLFPNFRPNFIMILKKLIQQNKAVCSIFEGVPKIEGGPRKLPHSPHPISTTFSDIHTSHRRFFLIEEEISITKRYKYLVPRHFRYINFSFCRISLVVPKQGAAKSAICILLGSPRAIAHYLLVQEKS